MEFEKWENSFIKYDISRNINPVGRNIKTFEAFIHITITKKYIFLGSKLKFSLIIGAKI
jgi:hypothetical protein